MNIPESSNTKRISIDLPEELISRFDQLRKEWGFRARGPVIEKILKELLQEDDLLPKNQQQEIDFNEKNNNENLNIDEDTALVLIKSDVKKEVNEISLNKRFTNNNQYKCLHLHTHIHTYIRTYMLLLISSHIFLVISLLKKQKKT